MAEEIAALHNRLRQKMFDLLFVNAGTANQRDDALRNRPGLHHVDYLGETVPW